MSDRRRRTPDSATLVEYGLMAALIAVVIISAITVFGPTIKRALTHVEQDARDQART